MGITGWGDTPVTAMKVPRGGFSYGRRLVLVGRGRVGEGRGGGLLLRLVARTELKREHGNSHLLCQRLAAKVLSLSLSLSCNIGYSLNRPAFAKGHHLVLQLIALVSLPLFVSFHSKHVSIG